MSRPASIEQLRVAHWAVDPSTLPPATNGAFVLDTCMRRLAVTLDRYAVTAQAGPAAELRSGAAGYQLLLEVATGLLSAVPGETNVFGQFRRAWASYRTGTAAAAARLAPLMAQVVNDTRAIRQRHLQNIGGASYGPLVRRLLRPADGDRILFVGTGDLARSMLPFFASCEIATWNRSPAGPAFAAAGRVFAPAEGAQAAEWANHVVMTTPADTANDELWAFWLSASLVQTAVRLGHRRGDASSLPAHLIAYDLDDVFELRRSQDKIRSLQLERARLECRELAGRRASATAMPAIAARLAAG